MASKYLQKFPIPEDFPSVLHDFAREVLRDQPADIIHYGFQYFKALEDGTEFDYPHKGKNIPPPKEKPASAAAEEQKKEDSPVAAE